MKKTYLLFVFVLSLFYFTDTVFAQITGLWEATSVQVGEESMTPIAKWTEFKSDGAYISGNGWLQNSDGVFTYNESSKELSMNVTTGFDDSFGPFNVEFPAEDEMIWIRKENGALVTVKQKRIFNIPKSPATKAVGLWKVSEVKVGGRITTYEFTKTEFQAVFIRWDNLLQEITSEGRRNGIWRVNAHRPVIDILYYDGNKPLQYWELVFENKDSMSWKRDEITITFNRLNAFPED